MACINHNPINSWLGESIQALGLSNQATQGARSGAGHAGSCHFASRNASLYDESIGIAGTPFGIKVILLIRFVYGANER